MYDYDTKVRFYRLIIGSHPDSCWPWIGGTTRGANGGYGRFKANGKFRAATHVAWEMRNGPLPKGLILRHTCDNPPCCNPDHLVPGTPRENTQDVLNRCPWKFNNVPEIPAGVTLEMVAYIQENPEYRTARELAARLNLPLATVYAVQSQVKCRTSRDGAARTRTPHTGIYDRETKARFYQNIRGSHPDCCWEWTGSARCESPHGIYGAFHVGTRNLLAHRVAWEIVHGPLAPGLKVLHRCDNPACVNPSHLFVGTMKENCLDRSAKGHHNKIGCRPALTMEQVAQVRSAPASVSDSALARTLGVNRQVVTRCRRRVTYARWP